MAKRQRPKFLPMRDPEWRSEMAVRIGIPVLGGTAAVLVAWFITQL